MQEETHSGVRPARVVGSVVLVFGAELALVLGGQISSPFGLHPLFFPLGSLLVIGVALRLARAPSLSSLGLVPVAYRGIGVALVGSLGMAAVLLTAGRPVFALGAVVHGAVVPGVVEELVFRGYAFRRLRRDANWGFVPAMLFTGVVFGSFHVPGALLAGEGGALLGTVALTTAGGCWYAWLMERWDNSVWVPVAMHVAMNGWWVVFSAGATAGSGGSAGLWSRVVTIAAVCVATAKLTAPLQPTGSDPSNTRT